MKYLLSLGLLYAMPAFGQWFASVGMEQQVFSSTRLQSPANPIIELGRATKQSIIGIRLPIEPNSTHWSQPSWWGTFQYVRSIYNLPELEGLPEWFPDFSNTAYGIGRLSFFRNQTVVEDHVSGFENGLWQREEYTFSYQNPSIGIGAGLRTRLKNTELFAEGGPNLGTELRTSVYKGTLNADGSQTSIESYTYDEKLRFVFLGIGLRTFFERE